MPSLLEKSPCAGNCIRAWTYKSGNFECASFLVSSLELVLDGGARPAADKSAFDSNDLQTAGGIRK